LAQLGLLEPKEGHRPDRTGGGYDRRDGYGKFGLGVGE
jgi:hypothetical protein